MKIDYIYIKCKFLLYICKYISLFLLDLLQNLAELLDLFKQSVYEVLSRIADSWIKQGGVGGFDITFKKQLPKA